LGGQFSGEKLVSFQAKKTQEMTLAPEVLLEKHIKL
jgi:hypothetical protein